MTGAVLQWFRSYLTHRSVTVAIGNVSSDPVILDCSLPQGSKLGPRSYSDYTQPLGCLLRYLLILYHFYADDSQLFKSMSLKSTKSQHESAEHLSKCIQEVEKWTFHNKLKLNPNKTEFMVLCNKRNRHKVAVSELVLNDNALSETKTAKNLGVWIDNSLTMERHVNEVCKVCLYYLNWIRNIRPCLTVNMTKSLVQTLVISRIDYCNALLYKLPAYLLNKIQRVMNMAARLIFRASRDCSISELLRKLHWLKIEDRINFKILTLTWKCIHNETPDYISNLLSYDVPSRSLRSSTSLNLHIPRTRTKYGDRSFQKSAPENWNRLPLGIRKQSSFQSFKRALKTYLFKNSYNC